MGRILYNLILHLGLVLFGPFLMIGLFFSGKRRISVLERLGIVLPSAEIPADGEGHIWIHVLSVGEFRSAEPLINRMVDKYGGSKLVLTTSTMTGQSLARQRYGGRLKAVGYFPYDIPWAVGRVLKRINPELVVLVESDLWPNFLAAVNRRNIPTVWANARISAKSFKGYRRYKAILKPMFNQFDAIAAQTEMDAERLKCLGVPGKIIAVTGNIKFDQPVTPIGSNWIVTERQKMGWADTTRLIVAGSTHAGEEKQLFAGFRQLQHRQQNLGLIVAPRDPKRAEAVIDMGGDAGFNMACYSRLPETGALFNGIVVDQMGLLRSLYALADVAFIGGSLIPFGGHNPIEAAVLGKPMLWGPHMDNFVAMAAAFINAGAAREIDGPKAFENMVAYWLNDSTAAATAGTAGRKLVLQNRGSVARIMAMVERVYGA